MQLRWRSPNVTASEKTWRIETDFAVEELVCRHIRPSFGHEERSSWSPVVSNFVIVKTYVQRRYAQAATMTYDLSINIAASQNGL